MLGVVLHILFPNIFFNIILLKARFRLGKQDLQYLMETLYNKHFLFQLFKDLFIQIS